MSRLKKEFQDFMASSGVQPPKQVTESILQQAHRVLQPTLTQVLSRLSFVHFFAGILTLSFCPQLGVSLFRDTMGLAHVFMALGPIGCQIACGFTFMAISLGLSTWVLKPEEIRVLRQHRLMGALSLTALTLGALIMLNAELVLGLTLAWTVGSAFGGVLAFEAGWALRKSTSAA